MNNTNQKLRFDVALSFAGEIRPYVEQLADELAKVLGQDRVLYDKFHEAEFARNDLGLYLPMLYREQSALIVPILTTDYAEKQWTGWEWTHIFTLLTNEDNIRVMPCRFHRATVRGLTPASGFIELDDKTPFQAAQLILRRLTLNHAAGPPLDRKEASLLAPSEAANLLSEKIIAMFLPKPYQMMARIEQEPPFDFSDLSLVFNLTYPGAGTPILRIERILRESTTPVHVSLSGRPGTGKTSLLALLYLHLLREWKASAISAYPIMLGIRPAIGFWSEQHPESSENEQMQHIEDVLALGASLHSRNPDIKFYVLFDSGEAETPFVNNVRNRIREFIKSGSSGKKLGMESWKDWDREAV